MSVRSMGRIPGGYVTNHVYTWVDPQGRSVSPPPDLLEHRSATLNRYHGQLRSHMQLLQDGDEKKVRRGINIPAVCNAVRLKAACTDYLTESGIIIDFVINFSVCFNSPKHGAA